MDDSEVEVDAVIFCTGYDQNHPYLDDACGMKLIENFLYPTHKLFVHPHLPTLFFNGLTRHDPHFVVVSITAKVIRNLLLGVARLPSEEEMMAEMEKEMERCRGEGKPLGHLHRLGPVATCPWPLEICQLGNIEPPMKELKIWDLNKNTIYNKKFHLLRNCRFFFDESDELCLEMLPEK